MRERLWFVVVPAIVFVATIVTGGCDDAPTCPAKEAVAAGAPCVNDGLQCPYDVTMPNPACDGTTITVTSSCFCAKGSWSCPSAGMCAGPTGGDGGGSGDDGGGSGDDGGATSDDGGDDSPVNTAPTDGS